MDKHVTVTNRVIKVDSNDMVLIQHNINADRIVATFDEEWDGLKILVTFTKDGRTLTRPYKEGGIEFPPEIMPEIGSLYVGFVGLKNDAKRLVTRRMVNPFTINESSDFYGELSVDATPDFVQQLIEIAKTKKFDPSIYNIPVLYLDGNVSEMTKDNAVTLEYKYEGRTGSCTVKWQGSSSLAYPKKNYTVKFDQAFEVVEGWGAQKKYCLKANWIDHSHARNIVSAKLWGQVVEARTGTASFDSVDSSINSKLAMLPNKGAIDGIPVSIVLNEEFHGLYTFNIPKDGWMFGMGNGISEAILCAENHSNATNFLAEPTVGVDFELEYVTNEDDTAWVEDSLDALVNSIIATDGTNLTTEIAERLDWLSVMDYMIFTALLGGNDMTSKNYLLATYDGTKWFFSPYDMDSTYGLEWSGSGFITPSLSGAVGLEGYSAQHRAMRMVRWFMTWKLKTRYNELRKGVLSDDNVTKMFYNYAANIPRTIYDEEVKTWPGVPLSGVNHIEQIVDWYKTHAALIDAEVSAL